MVSIICYDFETYFSRKDYSLSKMGPIEYIRDERFDPFMVSIGTDSRPVSVWANSSEQPTMVRAALEGYVRPEYDVLIAHNGGGFDHLILSEHFGIRPRNLWDTIWIARWVGLASVCAESHAAITEKLGNGVKQAGTVVSDGKHWPQDFTPDEQKFFSQYCIDDTAQMRMNLAMMLPYCTDDCLRFMSLTARMATEPVFELDEALLEEYIKQLDAEADEARRNLMQIFHFSSLPEFFTALRSAEKFAGMLRELGVEPPMKLSENKTATAISKAEAAGDVEEVARLKAEGVMTYAFAKNDVDFILLTEHEDPRVRLLVETRLEFNGSMVRSRAETLLKYARYKKPVPIMLSAFKAHTGRYSAGVSEEEGKSDSLQFQNLSKRNPVYRPLRQAIKAPAGHSVVAVDSCQIEARCLAWEANHLDLLGYFRDGRDPYAELAVNFDTSYTAEQIHDGAKGGDEKCKHFRNLGKVFVLSCLAGNTQVLTDTGWKRIDTVSVNDKLWDGESWVQHQGLICNGRKKTVNLDGVFLTPDHLIWNGTTWSMAEELLQEPSCFRQAQSFAGESLKTCGLFRTNVPMAAPLLNIRCGAQNAGVSVGLANTHLSAAPKTVAPHALLELEYTSSLLSRSILTQTPVPNSGNLQLFGRIDEVIGKIRNVWNVLWKSPVHAGVLVTKYFLLTLCQAKQLAAINAPNGNRNKLDKNYTGVMPIFVQTRIIGGDCLTVFQIVLEGVLTKTIKVGRTMVDAVSQWSLRTVGNFLRTCSRSPVGTTLCWNSTELTTYEAMRLETFAFAHGKLIPEINVVMQTCKNMLSLSRSRLQNYKLVYDIMNSGPNNRFMIKTDHGCLLVHNCGYGVGTGKVARKLWTDKVKLHADFNQHSELAKSYLQIYRASNPNIVYFWKICQQVIEALALGCAGSFGGPNNDTFKYGVMPIMGHTDWAVPTITTPSGYALRFPNLRAVEGERKIEYVYDLQRGKNKRTVRIYGGKLAENLTQCFAFQILMWQACRMDEAGIPLAGNNHDCWYNVVPDAQARDMADKMVWHMRQLPAWAPGLPIDAEAEIAKDFSVC